MPSGTPRATDHDGHRAGGARADFVASLGRKVHDARGLLAVLEGDPSARPARDELRRRLHALGAGARLLHLEAMAHALHEGLAVLDRGTQSGDLPERDVTFVGKVLDDLPALAWGEGQVGQPEAKPGDAPPDDAREPLPMAALVVGDESLGDALGGDRAVRARAFECERSSDTGTAIRVARAHAPDVLLVDVDLPGGPELVEALLDDPLTEPVPIVVVGTFRSPEEVARFVALGVAKTIARPFTPELLRAACTEVVEAREGRTVRVTLGEPTLDQLAERLADELKHALVDGVDLAARCARVPLGEGTEVLGALWGAIARIQELVSHKTKGAIRFGGETPEGAVALAPWIHRDLAGADRVVERGRGAAVDVNLQGRRAVVADDDPGVTWFVSDLLRTAGCDVYEALDGASALDLAFRVEPDLVISDILMPGLDGFALCRALRRDVALRDTPVILLSWKEDLLQRVRELGASAAAYLRKESGSHAILARVREVLRPRARFERRLREGGEVRGRLDGLTPRLLLDLVCAIRKDARVSVRDATSLHEVEVRDGAPRKATRTASDGSYRSGDRALASLLGVGAGRFVVTPTSDAVHGELVGTLAEQLMRPVALARGALAATAGARTPKVERIVFDEQALGEYLVATPEPTRALIEELARGSPPRQILMGGQASPSLLEDILSDLAARGVIQGVEGEGGVDLMGPAIHAALTVLRAAPGPHRVVQPNASSRARAAPESLALGRPPPPAEDLDATPSSLEDAVMRELSDRAVGARGSRAPTSDPPPIVEPSLLRRRSSNPPEAGAAPPAGEDRSLLPSIPPDAVVPAAGGEETIGAAHGPLPEARGPAPTHPGIVDPRQAATEPPAPEEEPAPSARPARGRFLLLLAIGLLGVAIVWRLSGDGQLPFPARDRARGAIAGDRSSAPTSSAAAPPPAPPAPSEAEDDLPPGSEVPPGFGLLEVRAPAQAVVRIDGAIAGTGPFVANVATPGYHEVRVEQGGHAATHVIEIRRGKATRVGSTPIP